jgi:hypothetical protein
VYAIPGGCTIRANLLSTDGPEVTVIGSDVAVFGSGTGSSFLRGFTITGSITSEFQRGYSLFENDIGGSVDTGSEGGLQIVDNHLRGGVTIRGGASIRNNRIDFPGVMLFSDFPREAVGNVVQGELGFNSVGAFRFEDNTIEAVDVGIRRIVTSHDSVSIRIVGNTIRGGNVGISLGFSGTITDLTGLLVARNRVSGFKMAGVAVSAPDLPVGPWVIEGNVIDGALSDAAATGDGIVVSGGGAVGVRGNTIVHTATGVAHSCSQQCFGFSSDLESNVIAMSSVAGVDLTPGQRSTVLNNDVYQSGSGWVGVPDPTGTNGNISTDPQFRSTDVGDLTLQATSECLERGLVSTLSVDQNGLPRSLDGNLDGVALPDMGAFETRPEVEVLVEATPPLLRWDEYPFAWNGYDVYQGTLSLLSATGQLVQSAPVCGWNTTAFGIGGEVPEGDGFFYLVVPHGAVPGSLGFDSNLLERVNPQPCP